MKSPKEAYVSLRREYTYGGHIRKARKVDAKKPKTLVFVK